MNEYFPGINQRQEPESSEAWIDTGVDLLECARNDDSEWEYLNRAAHNNTDYAGIYDQQAAEFENGDDWDALDSSHDTE